MRRTKEQKGITLIALIITIVVLLILAVVAINSIQNDGIISHAGNTADTYNQAVKNEQETLQNYLDYLDENSGPKTYKAYTVGEEIKVTKDGEKHLFYVIQDSDTTQKSVILVAQKPINTDTLKQENPNTIKFSETNYWYTEGVTLTYPYDLTEEEVPDESHYAAYAAYEYGTQFGEGANGRLLNETEENNLAGIFKTKLAGSKVYFLYDFWCGRAINDAYAQSFRLENEQTGPDTFNLRIFTGWMNEATKGYVLPVVSMPKSLVAVN